MAAEGMTPLTFADLLRISKKIREAQDEIEQYQRLNSLRNVARVRAHLAYLLEVLDTDERQERKAASAIKAKLKRSGDRVDLLVRAANAKAKLVWINRAKRGLLDPAQAAHGSNGSV